MGILVVIQEFCNYRFWTRSPPSILFGNVREWLLYNKILSRFQTALVKRKMTVDNI